MKVLICLFAIVAVATASVITSNGLYSSGVLNSGSIISAPASVAYVHSAPAVHTVQVVRHPSVYQTVPSSTVFSAPAQIYRTASIHHYNPSSVSVVSSPVISGPVISSPLVSAPLVSAPIVSTPLGLNSGLRYASTYGIGAPVTKIVSGIWKQK